MEFNLRELKKLEPKNCYVGQYEHHSSVCLDRSAVIQGSFVNIGGIYSNLQVTY